MCIGWLSKKYYFVQLYLKPECPIPKTSSEWMKYFTQDAKILPDHFLERMEEFTKSSDIKREANKKMSKNKPLIV